MGNFHDMAFGGETAKAESNAPANVLSSFARKRQDAQGNAVYLRDTRSASQVGNQALASGDQSTSVGALSTAAEDGSTAVGVSAIIRGKDSTGVGQAIQIKKAGSTAIGRGSIVNGINGILMGSKSSIQHENVILIGNELQSTDDDQILIATDGNTTLRVDFAGNVFINGIPFGGNGVLTPNFGETGAATITMAAESVWSSWTQLIASTANIGYGVMAAIYPPQINVSTSRVEVQFGIGGVGAEASFPGSHVIYLKTDTTNTHLGAENLHFTYSIPAGSRISTRARFVQAGATAASTALVTATIMEVA